MSFETEIKHGLEPFINEDSEILILGSFPSVLSRKAEFYYANPRNRFFKVLAGVFDEEEPITTEERKLFLRKHKIALFDVVKECEIKGSSDNSIKNVVPNDIASLVNSHPIKIILVNGSKANELYLKLLHPIKSVEYRMVPSTSPANTRCTIASLIKAYKSAINLTED